VIAKVSDDEDEDDRLGDADGNADSEKLSQLQSMELSQSQSMETPSDKPDTPRCQLRSGIADPLLSNCSVMLVVTIIMY
jgi:transcription factor E2F7/8